MSTVTEYKAISSNNLDTLNTDVNLAIADGFQPFSPLYAMPCTMEAELHIQYCQNMVKVSEE